MSSSLKHPHLLPSLIRVNGNTNLSGRIITQDSLLFLHPFIMTKFDCLSALKLLIPFHPLSSSPQSPSFLSTVFSLSKFTFHTYSQRILYKIHAGHYPLSFYYWVYKLCYDQELFPISKVLSHWALSLEVPKFPGWSAASVNQHGLSHLPTEPTYPSHKSYLTHQFLCPAWPFYLVEPINSLLMLPSHPCILVP